MKKKMYRQGDILLMEIERIPTQAQLKDSVLARGEVTGHSHQFAVEAAVNVYLLDSNQYIEVIEPAVLEHEEHNPLEIERGLYQVIRQREFDIMEQVRQIAD